MHSIIRKILAVAIGWFGGAFINMALIQLGHIFFPIDGVDPSNMEALAQAMPSMGAKHFIFPFLAHALGTFVGAFLAALIALKNQMRFAMIVGVLFFIGGIMVNYMLPGPVWFTVLDLLLAYIPMAWLGGKLAMKLSERLKKNTL